MAHPVKLDRTGVQLDSCQSCHLIGEFFLPFFTSYFFIIFLVSKSLPPTTTTTNDPEMARSSFVRHPRPLRPTTTTNESVMTRSSVFPTNPGTTTHQHDERVFNDSLVGFLGLTGTHPGPPPPPPTTTYEPQELVGGFSPRQPATTTTNDSS